MRILILGATGLVGSHLLQQSLSDDRISFVVAPTRRKLTDSEKLFAPIINFDEVTEEEFRSWNCEAIICALGTTIKIAGSKEAFAKVDRDYPLKFANLGKACGIKTFVLNSAMGAGEESSFFYNQIKGQVERGLEALDFETLVLVRPGLIGGKRQEFRFGETFMKITLTILSPILPKKFHINSAEAIARSMLEASLSNRKGVRVISSEKII